MALMITLASKIFSDVEKPCFTVLSVAGVFWPSCEGTKSITGPPS
jgi:hypothetical protein